MKMFRTAASVVLLAALTACNNNGTVLPANDQPTPTAAPTTKTPGPEADWPVAGSGANLSPQNAMTWCAAITPEQLSALTGFEVLGVDSSGASDYPCHAELDGVDLDIRWGSEPTRKTFEQYAESWTRPADVYDVTLIELPDTQPVVVATTPSPRSAVAGTVIDGRKLQALVTVVGGNEHVTVEDLTVMAQAIEAVYLDAGTTPSTSTPSEPAETETAAASGPVDGSGAAIDADDTEQWCAAITPDQMSALIGFKVDEVVAWGVDGGPCRAVSPGVELDIRWGSVPTDMTHETYSKTWRVQLATYNVTDIELGSHPAVLATQPDARTAFAGAIIDGRRLEARVTVVSGHEKVTLRDLAVMAQAIAGVYTS